MGRLAGGGNYGKADKLTSWVVLERLPILAPARCTGGTMLAQIPNATQKLDATFVFAALP